MKGLRELVIAMVILIAAGGLLRSVSHGEETPIHKSLASFPLHIDQWHGTEQEFESDILQVLKVDDYLLRQYRQEQGTSIGLYVGYYKSMRQGATYHSPKNCLPGSGWYFVDTGKTHLAGVGPHGQPVEINKFVIQKGLDKQLVLYWYQDRGRIITSEYWAKIYMVLDAITKNRTDGAFVRITVPYTHQSEEEILAQGKAFAEQIFPRLQEYLPSL
jgi:EpsI family protein